MGTNSSRALKYWSYIWILCDDKKNPELFKDAGQ